MTAARLHRHRAIPKRRTAVASVLLFFGLLVGMLLGVDLLRHPFPGDRATPPPVSGDPRAEVDCPAPSPVEGDGESEPQVGPAAALEQVSSAALYDCPLSWDDRRVLFRGEVVGAVLRRGEQAWLQLNDDVYAVDLGPLPSHRDYRGGNAGIGVLVPRDVAEQIRSVGGPRTTGDILEVTGTFRRIDPASREVAVIVAGAGEVIARGEPISEELLTDRAVAATLLTLLAAVLVVAERLVDRRRS